MGTLISIGIEGAGRVEVGISGIVGTTGPFLAGAALDSSFLGASVGLSFFSSGFFSAGLLSVLPALASFASASFLAASVFVSSFLGAGAFLAALAGSP